MFQWPKRGDGSETAREPFRDIGDLKGQVAVISGSTSGIGLAFARAIASPHLTPVGLACHIGSQITELEPFEKAFKLMGELTEELRGTGIVVNSVSPGFVKTDLTGYGVMTPAEGARLPVQHALGGTDNGGFIEPDGYTPW